MAIRGNSAGMESDSSLMSGIPSTNKSECPDCGCPAHWKHECNICGCADGPTRKRERDEGIASSHGDSRRPAQGFY